MASSTFTGIRLAAGLAGSTVFLGIAAASAQAPTTPPGFVQVPDGPDAVLARNLITISANPRDTAALVGAGRAALALGDPQSALNFFGRAEEVSPRDGQIKAGMASALVLMEQARTALPLFEEARALGVPEAELAADRGLAYDLTGDPRRAQRDYQLALRHADNPEVRRRLALSLAISGERAPALAAIEDQLRRQDRAAWRTRAFVLALTGDTAEAKRAVDTAMPGQGAAMEPFLARLPSLNPADRALAVNFGHFPGSGIASASAAGGAALPIASAAQPSATPGPSALSGVMTAGAPDPGQRPLGSPAAARAVPAPASAVPPAAATAAAAPPVRQEPASVSAQPAAEPVRTTLASVLPSPYTVPGSIAAAPSGAPPDRETPQSLPFAAAPGSASPPPLPSPTSAQPEPATKPVERPVERSVPAAHAPAAHAAVQPTGEKASPTTARSHAAHGQTAAATRLADIAALIESLPAAEGGSGRGSRGVRHGASDTAAERTAKGRTARSEETASDQGGSPSAARTKGRKAAAAAKAESEPSRIWVQVAHGATIASLQRVLGQLEDKAPKAFRGRALWTSSARSTNRLLVGPFKSDKAAQAYIDQLARDDVDAVAWTSDDGQEIKKLPPK